jgi:hypothetical protein
MSEDTLSGINFVITTFEDDEWSGDENLLVIGNCSGHLLFFVWPNLSYEHCWYVRKLNVMKVENLTVICEEPMIISWLDSKLVLKRKKDTLDQVIIHRLCLIFFWHEAQGRFSMFKKDHVCASSCFANATNLHIFHIRNSLWIVVGNEDECIWDCRNHWGVFIIIGTHM